MLKGIVKVILIILMTFCCLGLVGSYFVEAMFIPEHLNKAVEDIDMMPLIQENISDDYEDMIKNLMKTEEFEVIVDEYVDAFVTYVCDGKTTYTISDETEANLFRQYSAIFLDKYPQLKFLPTELFVSFLVERIDLNDYLPAFSDLKEEIPVEFFEYKDKIVSQSLRHLCWGGVMFTFVFYCILSKKISFYSLGISNLLVSLILILFMSRQWFIYIPNDYQWLSPSIVYFTSQLNDSFKFCIIVTMGCFIIEWGKLYAKKIFLF